MSTLTEYITDGWDLDASLQPSTKALYARLLGRHVQPVLGDTDVTTIGTADVQRLLSSMRQHGASPFLLYQTKAALSHVMRGLVEDGVLAVNPARKVRLPKREVALRKVLSPEDVKAVLARLTPAQGLLVRVLLDSGMRFGEVTELRAGDVDLITGAVVVARSVADVGAAYHPDGSSRFVVKRPKSGRERVTSVSDSTAALLGEHIRRHRLGVEDLLFPLGLIRPSSVPRAEVTVAFPAGARGRTSADDRGHRYAHGTVIAYTKGRCRCEHCRAAMSAYGKSRRAARPRRHRSVNASGHLPKDVWARIWRKAVADAEIGWAVRTHDLRHANATWLLKNGMDLHTVKERLGHHSITVTEGYLHRIAGEDRKATAIIENLIA